MIPHIGYAPGGVTRRSDPKPNFEPQLMMLSGQPYWISAAQGCAISTVTAPGETDHLTGTLAILNHQYPLTDGQPGLGLLCTFTPDEADEFADMLRETARNIRCRAAEAAALAIARAARK